MDKFKNKYLTISQFANLCGVSRKTLIFYDTIGVFSPEYRDKNNYRYYSLTQYDTFNILLDLREIGVSLEEIKSYFREKNPQSYVNMLKEENKKVKKKIQKLKDISKTIENKMNVTIKGINAMENEGVYIKNMEEEYLTVWDLKDSQKDIMVHIIEFVNYCNENNIYSGYPIGAMVSKESIKNQHYTEISKLFIKTHKKIKNLNLHKKKAGLYACINHKGSYESTYISYEKLLKYIYKNNYKILGDSYENDLLDFFAVKSEEEYLTEICIPIK